MISTWIGAIGGLVGIVVFLGAAASFLRGSKDKGTIATLESSNQSLLQWQSVAKAEIEGLKTSLNKAEARIGALEQEKVALLAQRPSAEVLANLTHRLDEHDQTMQQLGEKIMAKIQGPT